MDKKETRLEDLDVEGVSRLLLKWEMQEFVEFVTEKHIDGRNLLEVTEGVVKLWRPKANAKKFLEFIQELKLRPEKYLKCTNEDNKAINKENITVETNMEAQYQTVNVRRIKEQITSTSTGVEEILKKIVPAKSFLYRHQPEKVERDKVATSYVPMNAGTPKPRKLFRLSSFTYPDFDIKHFRLSKTENFNDRGYYQVKTNTKTYMQQKSSKKADSGTKYKSLTSIEDIERFSDEHFYEDLNYYDMDKVGTQSKDTNSAHSSFNSRMVKIHDMFTSFKLPFLKRAEDLEKDNKIVEDGSKIEENSHNKRENMKPNECDKCGHIYENSDSVANMYDSIHVNPQENKSNEKQGLPVEDYLEPVQLNKDYCDVAPAPKDDSILRYILNIFEHLSMKRGKRTTVMWHQLLKMSPAHNDDFILRYILNIFEHLSMKRDDSILRYILNIFEHLSMKRGKQTTVMWFQLLKLAPASKDDCILRYILNIFEHLSMKMR
ncbi:hypothetical protein NE865_16051 [Phthorimaea operculella]|nr:hypothetical protein NE865_16051 [Phthorimaea operculella]